MVLRLSLPASVSRMLYMSCCVSSHVNPFPGQGILGPSLVSTGIFARDMHARIVSSQGMAF
jgi:hypothetical protein